MYRSIDRNINSDLGKRYVGLEGVDCVCLAGSCECGTELRIQQKARNFLSS
jgi:hypothetical protein